MNPVAAERFTRLYESHYLAVLAYCTRRVGRSAAEDVSSEVFTVLWRKMDSFDPELPLPWLYRVAFGLIQNRRRSARRALALTQRLGSMRTRSVESAEVVVVRNEQDQDVFRALARLRETDQEVLRLSIWEGLGCRDIGTVVGCSTSAAEQRLHRAKKRLAQKLSPSLHRLIPSPESLEEGGRP
jgi:RNA polymerase sigma factor (sigma-70 family)